MVFHAKQRVGVHRAAIAAACFSLCLAAGGASAQPEAVRPEVGKPLQAAQELIKGQRFKEALLKVRDAEAAGAKSAAEGYLIERMRLAAASGLGDIATAGRAFEAAEATGRMPAADRLRMLESLAIGAYRAKDMARAMSFGQRYLKEGGSNDAVRSVVIQAQYLSGDYAGTVRTLNQEVQATEKAGGVPGEERLTLWLNAAQRIGDPAQVASALEKLVTHHPKQAYWSDLIARVQRKPAYSDRLALDAYRLQLATGAMASASDFMEMAQLAVQAGLPAEAVTVLARGFDAGLLGAGAEAGRHQRLRELAVKRAAEAQAALPAQEAEARAAKEGDALVGLGLNQLFAGQPDKGLALIRQGLDKPRLRRADDARLHLGVAQAAAGQSALALAAFKTVGGADGTADLARLWALQLRRKP